MMILSIGLVLSIGFLFGWVLNKIKIPGLVGMILAGLIIGPYCLNLIDNSILNISSELRQIALVIILTRSGLNLDIKSLKNIGRAAILMSFVPATLEIIGVCLASHYLLSLSVFEGLLLGSVLAAVSPAVVSPRMIKLIEERYGEKHQVPKLILAGSSVDDIYVIVLFYAFLGLVQNDVMNFSAIFMIPVSIFLGILLGVIVGIGFSFLLRKAKFNLITQIILLLSISFLMIGLENLLKPYISISSLLAIIVMAMIILFKQKDKAKKLAEGYNQLWKVFEIILFVLVGATLDLSYVKINFGLSLIVLFVGLCFRVIGVYLCLIATKLTFKEKIFAIISYLPKATVQASIGGIALSIGLECGAIILMVSIVSILITAPLGALLIDIFGKRLLSKEISMKKIAFICVHNSCRSQIAEGLCKMYRKDLEVYSAGSEIKPLLNQDAVRIMRDNYGIDISKQYSKLITDIPKCDVYISMGCNVKCPTVFGGFSDDFNISDPTGKDDNEFIKVIEEIKDKIINLKI